MSFHHRNETRNTLINLNKTQIRETFKLKKNTTIINKLYKLNEISKGHSLLCNGNKGFKILSIINSR